MTAILNRRDLLLDPSEHDPEQTMLKVKMALAEAGHPNAEVFISWETGMYDLQVMLSSCPMEAFWKALQVVGVPSLCYECWIRASYRCEAYGVLFTRDCGRERR